MKKRGHFICHGCVQGVFFRASAQDEAEHLGLTGWVRNCPDGSVEIMAEGDTQAVDDFQAWCQHGPPYATVRNVEMDFSAATGEFEGFQLHV